MILFASKIIEVEYRSLQFVKPDESLKPFVPQSQLECFQAFYKCYRLNLFENRVFVVAFFKFIIWYPCVNMVNVMKPDIARKPL